MADCIEAMDPLTYEGLRVMVGFSQRSHMLASAAMQHEGHSSKFREFGSQVFPSLFFSSPETITSPLYYSCN